MQQLALKGGRWAILILAMVALLAACGGGAGQPGGAAEPTEPAAEEPEATEATGEEEAETEATGDEAQTAGGDAAAGEQLFNQTLIQAGGGAAAGCVTCHYVNAEQGDFTGPNLAGIATEAGNRVEGQSAEEYLRNSIVNPNDHVVEGFTAGVMPQNYGDILTDEEIDSLVAYLMTLE